MLGRIDFVMKGQKWEKKNFTLTKNIICNEERLLLNDSFF